MKLNLGFLTALLPSAFLRKVTWARSDCGADVRALRSRPALQVPISYP